MNNIKQAAHWFGSVSDMANSLGVHRSNIYVALRVGYLSRPLAERVEAITGGEILACTLVEHQWASKEELEQGLSCLLDYFDGNQNQCAKALGVSRQAITAWRRKGRVGRIGAARVFDATGGMVTKRSVRPDLFKS